MSERAGSTSTHGFEVERLIAAPPRLVWGFISDSDRNDRILNAPEVSYRYEDAEEAGDRVRLRIGQAAMPWGETQWQERGGWIEGDWFRGIRCMESGPIASISVEAKTPAAPEGTRLWVRFEVIARDLVDESFMAFFLGRMKIRMERLIESLTQTLTQQRLPPPSLDEPAAIEARRALSLLPYEVTMFGPRQEADAAELSRRLEVLRAAGCPEPMAEALQHFLLDAADEQLTQIRPFEWVRERPDTSTITPREALIGMLEATRAGLLDLQWQLICPSCRVSAGAWSGFSQATPSAHCVECDRAFALDMAQNVEAIFRPHEALRKTSQRVYCGGSPKWRPHIAALVSLHPGERRETSMMLAPGKTWLVRASKRRCLTQVSLEPGQHVALTLHGGPNPSVEVARIEDASVPEGRCALTLTNLAPSDDDIVIERANYEPLRALGVEMLTLPTFQRLFGAQAPSAGHELSVSALTVLFTDLKASTALYVALGDARAFAIVQQHFERMQHLTATHQGTIVKTIGDAVMAVFPKMTQALDAALAMIHDTHALHAHHDLALRIGLYEGPCLVVRANGVFDYFGTTVNMAARLQSVADPDEIAIHAQQLERPDVQGWRDAHQDLSIKPKTVYLRGLGENHCAVFQVPLTQSAP
jgi:class 3 adenylate cyclase